MSLHAHNRSRAARISRERKLMRASKTQSIWHSRGSKRYSTKRNYMTLLGSDTGLTLNKTSQRMNHQRDFRLGAWDGRFLIAVAVIIIAAACFALYTCTH